MGEAAAELQGVLIGSMHHGMVGTDAPRLALASRVHLLDDVNAKRSLAALDS